jgi:AraC-like DNA-binding protein
MEEYIVETKSSDLTPLFVGREACEQGHSFGPYIREYYLVHFCLGGKGVLKNKHGLHEVSAGQLFVIRPGEITTYTADKKDPWEYVWIAFRSDEVYFGGSVSVFDTPSGLDDKLIALLSKEPLSREGCYSVIYDLIYRTAEHDDLDAGDERIRRIRRYVKYKYMLPISVSSIAESFGFDRTYLYRAFKSRYGIGIKEYITEVRMKKAEEFLRDGFSVKESAHMVGYTDEFNFSKAYKLRYGIRPSKVKQ